MRSLRALLHVPIIPKALRPFNFLFSSRILAACSRMAPSFISKAPSLKSTIPPSGPTQQNETDKGLNFGKFSIADDKNKEPPGSTARRKRRRRGRTDQHADPARPDETTQVKGQPLQNSLSNPRIRKVLSSSKFQKISTQSAPNPSVLSQSVNSAMDQSEDPNIPESDLPEAIEALKKEISILTPPALNPSPLSKSENSAMDQRQDPKITQPALFKATEAFQKAFSTLLKSSLPTATPGSEAQRALRHQIGALPPLPMDLVTRFAQRLQNRALPPLPPDPEIELPQHREPDGLALSPPDPKQTYLTIASFFPTRLPIPQRLLIVLDLNGTVLYREVGSTTYKPRPFVMQFLNYCLENHVILIWSSAKPHNVDSVCKKLFTPKQHEKLLGVWARDTLGLTPLQYNTKTQVYKNLDRIWANPTFACNHPGFQQQGLMWSQKNTLLVDDNIVKAWAQPYNHVDIPEFVKDSNEATAQNGKDVLGQITAYLEEARMWDNVSAFVSRTRFEVDRQWAWNWGAGKPVSRIEESVMKRSDDNAVGGPSEGNNQEKEDEEMTDVNDDEEDREEGGVKLPTGH